MGYWFAVVRDELAADEPSIPLAIFETIEDAFAWGSARFAGKSFRLRRVSPRLAAPLPLDQTTQ